jgi:hypothetical protein
MRFLAVFLFGLMIFAPKGTEDSALLGRWRTPLPEGEDHHGSRNEFIFEEKGVLKGNKIIYRYDAEQELWEPYTAEQLANGNDDTWETENGFLTLKIREHNVNTRDQSFRYRIVGDTLRLWQGEIFNGKNESLTGKWSYELFDMAAKDQKFGREIDLTEDGKWLESRLGQVEANRYYSNGDTLFQLVEYLNGRQICPPDTQRLVFSVIDKKLFIWREPMVMELIRKK